MCLPVGRQASSCACDQAIVPGHQLGNRLSCGHADLAEDGHRLGRCSRQELSLHSLLANKRLWRPGAWQVEGLQAAADTLTDKLIMPGRAPFCISVSTSSSKYSWVPIRDAIQPLAHGAGQASKPGRREGEPDGQKERARCRAARTRGCTGC